MTRRVMSETDDNRIERVVMSKRLAREYLDDRASTGRSVTVFYTYEQSRSELLASIHPDTSYSEGFDHLTFLAETVEEFDSIIEACDRLDLAYDAV